MIRLWFAAAVAAFIAVLTPNPAAAQAPLPCKAFNGQPVPYIANPGLNNVGYATVDQWGRRIIIMNPNVLSMFSPLTRHFWFAHECAHHALPPHMNSEPAADCFAVRNLRALGMMTNPGQVKQMLQSISQLPGNVLTGHLPGPARAANMYACLQQP